jgi:flavin-binding protein dodecin
LTMPSSNASWRLLRTIDDIKEIWVSGFKAVVENNKIVEYRVNAKVTFLVKMGH